MVTLQSLPEEIRYLCQDGTDLQSLSQHRIIISTCVSSGMFFSLGLHTKHFTHVFIDEVSQQWMDNIMELFWVERGFI